MGPVTVKEMNGTAREVAMRRAGAGKDQLTIDNSRLACGSCAPDTLSSSFILPTHYPDVADVLCHWSFIRLTQYSCSEYFLHFFSLLPLII